MKVGISGVFRIVQRRAGKVIRDVSLNNSLTKRGALEIMARLVGVTNLGQSEGWNLGNPLTSLRLNRILEASFVALDRDDRIQYYFLGGGSNPAFPRNTNWTGGEDTSGNEVTWDNLPFLSSTSSARTATYTRTLGPGLSEEWRGLWIENFQISGGLQRIRAVIASAVLPAPITIGALDTLEVSWTLTLTPTFA